MSNLGPQQQNVSYDGILQIPGGVTAQLQQVQDGEGRATGLFLSSAGTNATTADSFAASVNGATISGVVPRLISDGFGDYLSVLDFGADSSGTIDSTTAIQNAINAAFSHGSTVLFPNGTYLVSTLLPKSNVVLDLCGSTLFLKNGTYERVFNGSAPGRNFSVLNGTIDGNQTNNDGNHNLSGASNFVNWDGITFKNVKWQNVYRTSLILDGTTKNVVLENIQNVDCGQSNAYGMYAYGLECYSSTSLISIRNFTSSNIYGFGIHFFGCTDVEASDLYFYNINYGAEGIPITITQAKRIKISNVNIENTSGWGIECNASTDVTVKNATIDSAAVRGFILGDNGTGVSNSRVKFKNIIVTNTAGAYSAVLNFMQYCEFDHLNLDKNIDTTAVGSAANDRYNVFSNSSVNANISLASTYYKKFQIKRVGFLNFYVNDHDYLAATFSNPIISGNSYVVVANTASTYINFNDYNGMESSGAVCGKVRVTSYLNNQQGTYHEFLFFGSNNNSTFNLSSVTSVSNLVPRVLTITADAANRRIVLTNGTGDDVVLFWTVDLHKADF